MEIEKPKWLVNPSLDILGVAQPAGSTNKNLVGIGFDGPDGKRVMMAWDTDSAELFIANFIRALRKMQGQPVIKADS